MKRLEALLMNLDLVKSFTCDLALSQTCLRCEQVYPFYSLRARVDLVYLRARVISVYQEHVWFHFIKSTFDCIFIM